MMRLGFNSAGTELVFEQVLREAAKSRMRQIALFPDQISNWAMQETFNYLEVGIAEGTTLASVAKVLRDETHGKWNAFGVDLLDGPYFNPMKLMRENSSFAFVISHVPQVIFPTLEGTHNGIQIQLTANGMSDLRFEGTLFHFCLIDGCHGQPCVERDFLAIEPLIAPGGIVAFHDALPEDQDQDFQEHCQMPISVRKALTNLKLTTGQRPGWEFVTEVAGDKKADPPGNGFMFFRRI